MRRVFKKKLDKKNDRIIKSSTTSTTDRTDKVLWLADWFYRHINQSRVILYLEVRESRLIYVHIYTCFFRAFFFLHTVLSNTNNFKLIYLTHKWNPNRFYHSASVWTWENDNEGVIQTYQIFRSRTSPVDVGQRHT